MRYVSPNAPSKDEVLGTWMLLVLAGHRRYSHVTAIRCDGVNPGFLSMNKVISEDALRAIPIDAIYDEDRSQIRTGHGPVNMTRLRRFAVGLLKSRGVKNIARKIRQMSHKTRMVFDYLRMTKKYWAKAIN